MSSLSNTEEFHKALKSDPVNEDYIVETLSNLSLSERLDLRNEYKKLYGHPIQDDLNEYLSYKFRDLSLLMFDSPAEYDARELHRSLHSFMNDDKTICEIFASRNQDELELIDKAYQKFYGVSLKDDLKNETKKEYGTFLTAVMDTHRPVGETVKDDKAKEVARELANGDMKNLTKDVNLFKKYFLETSREDLINISRAFNGFEGKDLYTAIKKNTSGKNRKLIKNIMFATISPEEYFARKIYRSMQGLGTDNLQLNRAIMRIIDYDVSNVADIYEQSYGKKLIDDLTDDTSGSYQKVILNLCEDAS